MQIIRKILGFHDGFKSVYDVWSLSLTRRYRQQEPPMLQKNSIFHDQVDMRVYEVDGGVTNRTAVSLLSVGHEIKD